MKEKLVNLIVLYPYPFTDIDYKRLELDQLRLKHGYNVIIHDLSGFIVSKTFALNFYRLQRWCFNGISDGVLK